MSTPQRYTIRDYQMDNLLKKRFVSAWEVVKNVASQTAIFAPGTLSVGWSSGSPSYSQIPSSRIGAVVLAATTNQIDYLWRVPSEVDKGNPIYFRHHWSAQVGGATPTVNFNMYYQTVTAGTSLLAMSPTSAISTQVPANTQTTAADGAPTYVYNITGRGNISPLSTGAIAYQVLGDNVEHLHLTVQPVSCNWAIKSLPIYWLGMEIEYTERATFGDGSRREGRKMLTNLGFGEAEATTDY